MPYIGPQSPIALLTAPAMGLARLSGSSPYRHPPWERERTLVYGEKKPHSVCGVAQTVALD
jgi:hypothetical protein